MPQKDYLAPAYGSSGDRLAGWLREAVQEGDAWLLAQRPAGEWESIIKRIGAQPSEYDLDGQSNAQYNKTERVAREIVASLGVFSQVGEIKPYASTDLYTKAGYLTKIDHAWLKRPVTVDAHRSLLQSAVALGTCYAWQDWDRNADGPYRGDVRLRALSPQHVTFVQLPADHDIQKAYVTIIREELPINLAKRKYAVTNRAFADALVPDRNSPSWITKGLKRVQEFLSPVLQVAGRKPGTDDDASFPTVDIYHAFILDGSINDTGQRIQMAANTNWAYSVPYYGEPLPTALINPRTGEPFTRSADAEDCLLFPLRRYCIFAKCTDIVCSDGSSPFWHGQTPLVRLRFNDWPWEALGRSCVGMIRTIEDSANAIMQGIEDSVAGRLDPAGIYDESLVSKGFAENFNPRKAGARAAADLSQGEVIKFPVAPQYYDVPSWVTQWWDKLDDRMDYLTGARDLAALAKAKQLPSGDSMEKLLEVSGPLVQDMVRALVSPLQQLGTMRIALYLQFYTGERIIDATDADGEPADWQYKPSLLVTHGATDTPDQRNTRMKQLVRDFRYSVEQSGISEINRMTTKLFFLQLMKLGFPIDPWTIAKVAQIPRFGDAPHGTNSVIERWVAFKRMMAEFAEEFGGGDQKGARGRPNSGHQPPHLESKDGGTRTTVATS